MVYWYRIFKSVNNHHTVHRCYNRTYIISFWFDYFECAFFNTPEKSQNMMNDVVVHDERFADVARCTLSRVHIIILYNTSSCIIYTYYKTVRIPYTNTTACTIGYHQNVSELQWRATFYSRKIKITKCVFWMRNHFVRKFHWLGMSYYKKNISDDAQYAHAPTWDVPNTYFIFRLDFQIF